MHLLGIDGRRVSGPPCALLLIVVLAFSLRWGFWMKNLHDFALQGDALNYHIMAHQIVEDGVYGYALGRKSGEPNAYVTPGYPLFLSAVYAVVEDPYRQISVVRGIQVLVGSFTCVLAYLVVSRLLRRTAVALLTAFFVAIYPPYVQSPVQLLTEVLALATLLLYGWLAVVAFETRKARHHVAAGAALALHVLVRPVLLPLAILPFLFALRSETWRGRWREWAVAGAWTACGFVLLMLPWWVRNAVVLDQVILTATGSANPFLAGTYPYLQNMLADFRAAGLTSADQVWFARQRLIHGFTTEPLLYLKWYTIGKIQFLFDNPGLYQQIDYWFPTLSPWNHRLHAVFCWFGAAGLVYGASVSRRLRAVTVFGALFLGLYLLFVPTTRYAYLFMAFLMLGTAFLLCEGLRMLRSAFRPRRSDAPAASAGGRGDLLGAQG
ncbi:glycosyltransferase family 39 protein [Calditerricola yamamurae]